MVNGRRGWGVGGEENALYRLVSVTNWIQKRHKAAALCLLIDSTLAIGKSLSYFLCLPFGLGIFPGVTVFAFALAFVTFGVVAFSATFSVAFGAKVSISNTRVSPGLMEYSPL